MVNAIIHGDALVELAKMEANSIDLVLTDPPYFRVKGEAWDRQWGSPDKFIAWLDQFCDQWYRLLKPNGSLYCFASPKMAARVEVEIGRRFNVLNRIRWIKEEGWHKKNNKEALRSYLSPWEEIIFAEHYGTDGMAKGESGWGAKCDELRGFVFEPLRLYLEGERLRAGVDKAAINQACGFSPTPGGMASRHYFGQSQWCLPTAEHYTAMQELFNSKGRKPAPPYEDFHDAPRSRFEIKQAKYEYLRADYEELRADYEELRRPFNATPNEPYVDVWNFKTVSSYPGKHPCEKPLDLLKHIVRISSRPGAVVLDCFAGSGATLLAAKHLDRQFIGIDQDPKWTEVARRRIKADAPLLNEVEV